MIRKECVICKNNNFKHVFDIIGTIDAYSSSSFTPNEIETLKFIGCLFCGCIQLQNLFDIEKIYAQPMQCFNGPLLNKHHELFCNFIIKNKCIDSFNFFEIGGSYAKLANLIINYYKDINNIKIDYKILEVDSTNYSNIENIEYISGNCEIYKFQYLDTIIMSLGFEHLYEPRIFLNNIYDSDVKEVFISIPDMESLTKLGDINNLNIFHTYYIDTNFITYLFCEYKYELKNIYYYENNSIFYYFVKNENINLNLNNLVTNINLINSQYNFYSELKNKINSLIIDSSFFICPSGLYGRFVYYYLNEYTSRNVLGFLDGDTKKINKRLCGTKCKTFNKEYIKNIINPVVLIVSNKHKTELRDELLVFNNTTKFYYL